MWNTKLTPAIKKADREDSRICGFAKSMWSILHFGLDRLEVHFKTCSDTILELAKEPKWTRWKTKLRFSAKENVEYECIYVVSASQGFAKGISVKLDYKGHDHELFFISFPADPLKSPSKLRINGRMFRFGRIDAFRFSENDILEFVERHFPNPKVHEFDIFADLKVDTRSVNRWFLADVLADVNERVTGKKRWTNISVATDRHLSVETLYIGDRDRKDNENYLLRIYNKTLEVSKKSELRPLYAEYLDCAEEAKIFRFELSCMSNVANGLLGFSELKDPLKKWWLLLTQLSKRHVTVFDGLPFQKHKNRKWKSTVGGWTAYKLETMKLQHRLKTVITGMNKLEAEWIDPVLVRKRMVEKEFDPDGHAELVFYYENMLKTSINFFRNGRYRYHDFVNEIEGQIRVIETALDMSFDDFLDHVNGFVRPTLELMAKEQYKSLIFAAYVLYKRRVNVTNDKVLRFLRVFDEEDILDFSERNLKAEIKKFNSSKTAQFIYKQIDDRRAADQSDEDLVFQLIQKATEIWSYPVSE